MHKAKCTARRQATGIAGATVRHGIGSVTDAEGTQSMNGRNKRSRLVIQRETLRSLTDRSLDEVGGAGVYATTVDRCSTESMSKCQNPWGGACLQRK